MTNRNLEVDPNIYYDRSKLLSFNCLINFIVGERGNGKTYGLKDYCIRNFIKKKRQFIWLRRYETEFDDISLFFNDIASKFPRHTFKVTGGKFYINEEVAGFYFPLSKAMTKKSIPYPDVDVIVYDEFIIDKSNYHYLPNEPETFFDAVETIGRLRDVKCFLIANAISQANPFFAYFNIQLSDQRFTKIGSDIIVERTYSPNYREVKKNTRFGRIIDNTDYGKYAIENEFVRDNHNFIAKKSENARNIFNIDVSGTIVGVWADYKQGKIYISRKYNPELYTMCLFSDDMKPNYLMINSKSQNVKVLKQSIEYGYIYYESFKIKNLMSDVVKALNIR